MAEYELNLKTNADASALDELLEKLEQLTEVEQETGEIIISPDADTAEVDELANSLFEVSKAEEETGDKAEEAASEIDLMANAISAAASLGLAAEFQNTANAADNYNVSMAALNTVAQNNGISMDNVSSAISRVTDATTISGGQARSFFSLMMNMGVTSTDTLSDSLIYLQGQSAITGSSVEQMESKLTRLANSDNLGSRQLVGLGLSLEQLAETNGTTTEQISADWANMTADQRLEALNNAMAENSGLVETMNNTTSGQLAELQQAWAGLEIDVGQSTSTINQAILGTATGALKTLRSNLQNIPFAPTFLGGALAAGSLVTGMKPAMDTFNSLSKSVSSVGDMLRGFASAVNIVRNAESAGAAIKGLYNAALGVEATATTAKGAADAAATGPTTALAVAENLLLSPVVLVTLAIIALIAILWLLYNNNETVRAGVDALVQAFWNFVAYLMTVPAQVMAFVSSVVNYFNQLNARIRNALLRVVSAIISTIANWASAGASAASGVVNRIVGAFSGIQSRISGALSGVVNTITKPFRDAYNTAKGIWDKITSLGSAGINIGSIGSAGIVTGSAGINLGGANSNLMNTVTNSSTGTTNIQLNGIIEESAGDFIVRKLNDELYKQRVVRGI